LLKSNATASEKKDNTGIDNSIKKIKAMKKGDRP
jgi:hypothetical protein